VNYQLHGLFYGWVKKLKNQLNQENQKKLLKNQILKKKPIKILKKPTSSIRFYKSKTEKTKPNPN
jgi:hypothetical protein